MSRKVYVEVKVKVIMDMEEGIEVGEVISEMDYNFNPQTTGVNMVDTEILNYEVTDSK